MVGSSTSANGISCRLAFGHITAGPTSVYEGSIEMNIGGSMIFNTDGKNERMRINSSGNVGIGTSTPSAKLDVLGTFQLVDGTEASGYILTSDASGNASWQENSGFLLKLVLMLKTQHKCS